MNIEKNGYHETEFLRSLGFKKVGKNVCISKWANIVGVENIVLGDNVRIDAFTTITSNNKEVVFGDYVHIGTNVTVIGSSGFSIDSFSTLSHNVSVFTESDDYSGESMTNPMVPEDYKIIERGPVQIGKRVIIGSGTIIMPDIEIGDSCSVGALSLVKKSLEPFYVYAGIPVKKIKERKSGHVDLESNFKKKNYD